MLGLNSSCGFVVAKDNVNFVAGTYPVVEAPTFVYGEEHEAGSITVGANTYKITTTYEYGAREVKIYVNDVLTEAPFVSDAAGGVFGFASILANDVLTVWYIFQPHCTLGNAQAWYETQSSLDQHGPGVDYWAQPLWSGDPDDVLVDGRDWDETPSEDPNDPEGTEPTGGEFADRMPFDDTTQQTLLMTPNPEATMTMNYGKMLRTYVLTQAYLTSVASALFSGNFWTQLKNKFAGLSDPMELIVNCIQIPVAVSNVSTGTFRIGGVELDDDNGDPVTVAYTNSRYLQLDFGSITLKEVWGSAKDYSDCSISIYLPYVGVKELDPDICVGCTLTLKGTLDYWTGDVLYLLHVSNADMHKKYFAAQSFAYRWSGNCGKTSPIGRVDNTNKMLGIIGTIAGLTAGAAAVGVGLGGAAAGAIGAAGLASQGMAGAATGGITSGLGTATAGMAVMGATVAKALHSGFKPTVQSSSGVSGAPGQMDIQKAYIMVKRGVPKYPNGWRDTIGAPNYQTFSGVSMSGYTLFSEIHLTGMGDAAEEERAELERILCEEGVIL